MHGESGEFFRNFLTLKYARIFFGKEPLEVVSGQSEYCILHSYSVSQFLDESSNLKAGCKENAFFYDALDAI